MKQRLFISFSGGRTSALMTKLCLEKYKQTHEIVVLFANTGLEHYKTLEFVDRCDRELGFNLVWIEAEFNMEEGKGAVPKVVTYETAARHGEPFLEYVRKEGLPSPSNPSCSSRLKDRVLHKYIRQALGWKKGSYDTAIGIRADEMDRINPNYRAERYIYPLLDMGITKNMVKLELMTWSFDLELESEAFGNCVTCWKKSHRKLLTIAKHSPQDFSFFRDIETQFRWHKLNNKEIRCKVGRKIFRKRKSAKDILEEADGSVTWTPYTDDLYLQMDIFDPLMDHSLGCSESCEIGGFEGKINVDAH